MLNNETIDQLENQMNLLINKIEYHGKLMRLMKEVMTLKSDVIHIVSDHDGHGNSRLKANSSQLKVMLKKLSEKQIAIQAILANREKLDTEDIKTLLEFFSEMDKHQKSYEEDLKDRWFYIEATEHQLTEMDKQPI